MTSEEFAKAYAERSGVTAEWLKEQGMEVKPCNCGEKDCEGWQMAHVRELRWAVEHNVATPYEKALLEWKPD